MKIIIILYYSQTIADNITIIIKLHLRSKKSAKKAKACRVASNNLKKHN